MVSLQMRIAHMVLQSVRFIWSVYLIRKDIAMSTIDTSFMYDYASVLETNTTSRANALRSTLSSVNPMGSEDEELLEACKSFEAYFIEQVFKEMKKTAPTSDDDGEYMRFFGDMLTEQYA